MHTLARLRPTCSRETLELLLALMLAGMLGLALGLIGGLSTKYQLAFVIGGVLVGVLMLAPERRIWCMALWVMIQPLSIEKVFYVNAIYPDFVPQAVVFNAGDVLIFGMWTMHGSVNNTTDRWRLSSDTRFQPASEPVDERWVGENPIAHYAWFKEPEKVVAMEKARSEWGV